MKIQDLGIWEAFYRVATEGNFTRAAQKMRIGLPLLSKRIARLEEELGVRLFLRSTRKVSLTDEGRGLLPHLSSVLEDLKGLEDRFEKKETLEGTIRLTSLESLTHRLLSPILQEFHELHPKVHFELDLTDQVVGLVENQFDLAIRIDEPTDSTLVYRRLAPNRLVFCASPEYLKRNKAPIRKPEDLRNHVFLDLRVHDWCRFKDSQYKLGDFSQRQWIKCESGVFLTELARRGFGITARSIWDVGDMLKSGELVQLLKNHPLEDYGEVYAVIPSRRYLAHRVRAFIDFLTEKMKGRG